MSLFVSLHPETLASQVDSGLGSFWRWFIRAPQCNRVQHFEHKHNRKKSLPKPQTPNPKPSTLHPNTRREVSQPLTRTLNPDSPVYLFVVLGSLKTTQYQKGALAIPSLLLILVVEPLMGTLTGTLQRSEKPNSSPKPSAETAEHEGNFPEPQTL